MRLHLRFGLFIFASFGLFFLGSYFARAVHAGANVSFDFDNNGNSGGRFYFTIRNASGTVIKDSYRDFSGNEQNINSNWNGETSWFDFVDNPAYTITWEPVKPSGPDFRDSDCTDPVNSFDNTGIVAGSDVVYVVIDSFSCYTPSPPPQPSISVFFECSGTNSGIRITSSAPSGIYDIYWRMGGGSPRDGVTLGVFSNGPYYSGVSVGSFPYSNYTFTPGNTFSVDVLARNSSTSIWSSNGWMTGEIRSDCGGGGSPPTVDLKANNSDGPISVSSGSSVSVTWSTTNSPSSCSASGGVSGWPGAKALPSGGQTVTVNSSATFTITCSKSGFSDVSDSVTVNVSGGAPSCSASPSTVNINTNTTVTGSGGSGYTWSAPGGSPGSGSGNSFVVQYGTTGTKTVTVTSGGLTGSCSISVTQSGSGPTVSLTASPTSLPAGGGSSTLSWTVTNATSCTRSGAWSGSNPTTNGSTGVSLTSTSTYWITCSKAGYSDAQASATVTVAAGGGAKSCTFSKNPVNTLEEFTVISNNVPVGVNRTGQSLNGGLIASGGSSGPPTNFDMYYPAVNQGSTRTVTVFYSDSTSASCSVTLNPLPSTPGNLTISANGCLAVNQPFITFDWNAPTSGDPATSYTLEVRAASFTTDNTPNPSSGVVTVSGGATTQFTWDSAHPTSGTLTVPANYTNYWWRVRSNSPGGSSDFNYYDGTTGYQSRTLQQSFRSSNCAAPTSLSATPRACPNNTTVDLAWTGSATNWTVDVDNDNNFANGWMASKSIASGTSTTAPAGFNNGLAFTPGQTYYWRIFYNVPNAWANGPSFTIPVCTPTGLTVSGPGGVGSPMPSCATSAGYSVTLSWTSSGPGWFVDLSADPTFGSFSNKDVSNLTSTPAPAGFNPALTLLPNITYYWRIYYGTPGAHVYPPSSSVGPGTGFSVPGCLDLKARFVQPFGAQAFSPGDPVSLTVRVRNIGTVDSAATTVGLWLGQPGETNPPVMTETGCTSGVLPPPHSQNVGALQPGGQQQVTFNFNAPGSTGTYVANAYVIPNCDQADIYWRNNNTSGEDQVGVSEEPDASVGGFSYTVTVNAWFEAKNGDVGAAGGGVTMAQVPPSGSNAVSAAGSGKPLLVTVGTATAGGTSQQLSNYVDGITITGYSSALMSAGTYNYLADRYRQKAIDAGDQCSLGSLPAGLAYCPNGLTLVSGAAPAVNTAWFIDGDLVINGNITVPGALAFIVNGNITVNSAVSNIQGLYIASGTFTDVDASTGAGPQLVVNGAVYAGSILLPRELGGACGAICNNVLYPAASFVFDPKYLVNLNTLIGTPAVNWQEVAP